MHTPHNTPLPDCLTGAPYTPEACERDIERTYNRQAPKCSNGHPTVYSHAIGACRCEFGALVRLNGTVLRSC